MTVKDELEAFVAKTFKDQWTTRQGTKVPETPELGLGNDAVKLSGTVLYADLSESTALVNTTKDWFAAEVYKCYLYCAAKVIRARGGTITAYDGDRVMAVFIGDSKNTSAAKCALQIHYVVDNIIQPALRRQYPQSTYVVRQKVGVDTSDVFVARTGIRGSNDLVWVGRSANYAAKLATRSNAYQSYITEDVYDNMHESSKFGGNPKQNMWTDLGSSQLGRRAYGSTWWWSL